MIRKMICCLFCTLFCFWLPVSAQTAFDIDDIDTILEDNEFNDVTNRYSSVILSFFPERATRLGFSSANTKLDDRSPQHSVQALSALQNVRKQLLALNEKSLSATKQADYQLLLNDLDYTIWLEKQDRFSTDPLYYAEALDAVYDLLLQNYASPTRQRLDTMARLQALSKVADQAEKYLTNAPAFQAQLAMEKAYYAFLSMDEMTEFLLRTSPDNDTNDQIKQQAAKAKHSIKRLFDLFKTISREENPRDFRLGETAYLDLLNLRYQINQKPEKLYTQLQDNVQSAQERLTQALKPFIYEIQEEDVAVIDVADETATNQPVAKTSKKNTPTKPEEPQGLRNAQDFYAVLKRMPPVQTQENPLQTLEDEVQQAAAFFDRQGVFPPFTGVFDAKQMPTYYTYFYAHLFTPNYSNPAHTQANFFLRLPTGNQLAQQEQLNRDFNEPTRKLMISREIIPGRYYQATAENEISPLRRLYPALSTANGWSAYAQTSAQEQGYLISDEELLFTAWEQYLQALKTLIETKLHTRQFSYADAVDLLCLEHGLEQAQAEGLIKEIVRNPGQSLSFQTGKEIWQKLYEKYKKKQGKKFSSTDFYTKVLKIGNLTPEYLDKELTRLYKKERTKK